MRCDFRLIKDIIRRAVKYIKTDTSLQREEEEREFVLIFLTQKNLSFLRVITENAHTRTHP